MLGVRWAELFPTRLSVFIFVAYMALFVNQGILVTASQNADKKYSYNTTLVVLLTEVVKLFASVILYCKNESLKKMFTVIRDNIVLLGLYFVPSLLYCFYNNLAFANLTLFDPTTYYLLLQFRVVITALLFQIIFKKYLTGRQWIALIMLTIGCMVKHIDAGNKSSNEDSIFKQIFSLSALLILVQSFCSSLAGVYNEYLLKHKGVSVDIYIQNALMYIDSIVCNVFIIIFEGKSSETFNLDALHNIFHFNIIIIMLNSAAVGVITSFFLKTLNSILKTFASALELVFTAIACYLLFGFPINTYTVFSILIVSVSVVIYSQNPVDNRPKALKTTQDEVHLLDEESNV